MVTIGSPFFNSIREALFADHLEQSEVDGMNTIVAAWNEVSPEDDIRKLAYCLATTYHETGRTMQPVEEIGKGHGKDYGIADKRTGKVYYGRGYVQLTWLVNYTKMGTLLKVDLTNHPELALQPSIAAKVMFTGMALGTFTGRKLANYFNNGSEDPVNARRIINGLDKATEIATYYDRFKEAFEATATT